MSISIRRYVDIASGVGAGAGVRERELITRIFTINPMLPPSTIAEMTSASDVATYFGSTSEEYKRAAFYFGWVSKTIKRPPKISFARWADTASAARIYGKVADYALGAFTGITAGTFGLTLAGTTQTVGPVNLSTATSLSDVATLIQTAIRAETGPAFVGAVVTYNATRKSFDLVSGTVGAGNVIVTAGSPDLSVPLGWTTGAIFADGAASETITQTLTRSADISTNFASYLFQRALSTTEHAESAAWNDTQNVSYIYLVPTNSATAAATSAALLPISGSAVTLSNLATEYPEMAPGMVLAATDYAKVNAVENYMYQTFSLTPSVQTNADADLYDALRINYYGRTQTAGQSIDLYQRGVMMGGAQDPVDINVYANEIWLKDAMTAQIMSLLMNLNRVPANSRGRAIMLAGMQSVISRATRNGVISVGKLLDTTQKLYIGQVTGDDLAWRQVERIGYWIDCVMQSYVTVDGRTEYKAVYTLIYAKDDAVRKVSGSHVLI